MVMPMGMGMEHRTSWDGVHFFSLDDYIYDVHDVLETTSYSLLAALRIISMGQNGLIL
jgi:hypothetical protein